MVICAAVGSESYFQNFKELDIKLYQLSRKETLINEAIKAALWFHKKLYQKHTTKHTTSNFVEVNWDIQICKGIAI